MALLPHEREAIAHTLLDIAREAAALLLGGWRRDATVEHKGSIDLVTEHDRASEALLRARFRERLPGFDVVAEEHGGEATGERPVLYADPLDGTTNFAHGHTHFCVSLALVEGGLPLAAAVVAPALSLEYWAAFGMGAWRNGERCRVSSTQRLIDALLATGFSYDTHTRADNNLREFAALTRRTQGVRRCGSAALDLCAVAEGTYDGYWESRLKPWDIAAGSLMVREAGGVLSDLDGEPFDPRQGDVLASNGVLHETLLTTLRELRGAPFVVP
jgi:myo-inositol-1(or 4)-monophosphatase